MSDIVVWIFLSNHLLLQRLIRSIRSRVGFIFEWHPVTNPLGYIVVHMKYIG